MTTVALEQMVMQQVRAWDVLEERVLEERSLVQRVQLEIVVKSRERVNLREGVATPQGT